MGNELDKYLEKKFIKILEYALKIFKGNEVLDKKKYKELLGYMESSNNYQETNPSGALGKYQFMPSTLSALQKKYKLPDWRPANNFLNDFSLQEQYLERHIQDTLDYIDVSGMKKYIGHMVKGSKRDRKSVV